ncbi:hypothetical protein GCM10022416_09820 [Actinomadura keratinilytica]|uniref:Uncharacterized protein n=1 Tax=Actinomadura keratinilytica TaxID=547461 RepID=A0ABP7Y5W2_9ACTN
MPPPAADAVAGPPGARGGSTLTAAGPESEQPAVMISTAVNGTADARTGLRTAMGPSASDSDSVAGHPSDAHPPGRHPHAAACGDRADRQGTVPAPLGNKGCTDQKPRGPQ